MRLLELSVHNFYGQADLTHEYKPGVTGLLGSVGSGKSSFGEYAQYFAVTGNVPATVGKKENLISWGKSQGYTELLFEHDGIEYLLKRNLHSSSVKLTWSEGGEKHSLKQAQANELVEEMLGMSPEVFYECCFVRQGGLWDILLMTHADRMKYFQRITGTIKAEKLRKLVNETASRLPTYPDRTEEIAEATATISELDKKIDASEKEVKRLSDKLKNDFDETLEEVVGKLSGSLSEQVWVNKLNTAELDLKDAEAALAGVRKEIEKELGECPPEPAAIPREAVERYRRWNVWQSEREKVEKAEKRLAELKEDRAARAKELEAAERDLKIKEDAYDEAEKTNGELAREVAQAEKVLKLAEEGKCPTCGKDYEVSPEDARKKLEGLRSELSESLEKLKLAESEHSAAVRARTNTANELLTKEREISGCKAVLGNASKEDFSDFDHKAHESLVKKHEDYNAWNASYKRHKPRIDEKEREVIRLETSVEKIKEMDYLSDKEYERLREVKKAMAAISNGIIGEKGNLSALASARKSQVTLKEAYEKDMKKAAKVIELREEFETVKKYLHRDMLPKIVMSMLRASLAYEVHELLRNFDVPFTVELNEDFDYVVHWGEHRDRPVSALSGGQKIITAICHHLALANILADSLPVIFIDEPTNHLGDGEKDLVRDCLFTLRKNAGQTTPVLVGTHEDKLFAAFARTRRFEKR